MKIFTLFILSLTILFSCTKKEEHKTQPDSVNWAKRKHTKPFPDSLINGSSYLPVYSEIYHKNESQSHGLTATVSIRNTSATDSVFILRADYYNTKGDLIKTYFDYPIFLTPMETIEIVIDEADRTGGTGANFNFLWATTNIDNEPYFEAIMITTSHQLGISFVTKGINKLVDEK